MKTEIEIRNRRKIVYTVIFINVGGNTTFWKKVWGTQAQLQLNILETEQNECLIWFLLQDFMQQNKKV